MLLVALIAPWLAAAIDPAAPDSAAALRDHVRAYRSAHEAEILSEFIELLRLPNLARDPAAIRANADHILALLARRGIAGRLLEGDGSPPVVYGELAAPGAARTVVLYVHYDGQPVVPEDWASEPWSPTLRDGPLETGGRVLDWPRAGPLDPEWRLYVRSAGDDKAPIIALLAALDALRAANVQPSVHLKLFFEGEEEAGSPHLESLLRAHRELLAADLWLLCDGPVHQSRKQQVYFGARGVTDVELTLYGPSRALHSGHYGNWAPNPLVELSHLIAGMRDTEGRILIAGFYDDVRPPSEAERRALAMIPPVEAALRRSLALGRNEGGSQPLVERILLPALNLRGMAGGGVGARAANAIPVEARASIDFRLVPDQTPAKIKALFESHLRAQGYAIVREPPDEQTRRRYPRLILLEWGAGYPPARTALDLAPSRALLGTLERALGGPVLAVPTLGGSIPMYLFQEVLNAPVIGVPIANHDNNQHAANENLRLQNLWDGIEVFAALLAELGRAWSDDAPGPR
jgi:acetylornithine deacetylase/succinyl-diaminopimelate desuccinylase-like protein